MEDLQDNEVSVWLVVPQKLIYISNMDGYPQGLFNWSKEDLEKLLQLGGHKDFEYTNEAHKFIRDLKKEHNLKGWKIEDDILDRTELERWLDKND